MMWYAAGRSSIYCFCLTSCGHFVVFTAAFRILTPIFYISTAGRRPFPLKNCGFPSFSVFRSCLSALSDPAFYIFTALIYIFNRSYLLLNRFRLHPSPQIRTPFSTPDAVFTYIFIRFCLHSSPFLPTSATVG